MFPYLAQTIETLSSQRNSAEMGEGVPQKWNFFRRLEFSYQGEPRNMALPG